MSPEHRTPSASTDLVAKANPGLITEVPGFERNATEPGSAELADKPVDFAEQSQNLLTSLDGEGNTPEGAIQAVLGYMDSLKTSLDAGDVKSKTGETFTYDEIAARLSELERMYNSPSKEDFDPLELVSRSGGMRKGVNILLSDVRTANILLDVIAGRVSAETLAPKASEKVVRDLGDEALGLAAPEVAKDKIDSLSAADKAAVLQYRNLSREQFQAHREGDFLRSKDLKEAAFTHQQTMSPAAVAAIYN